MKMQLIIEVCYYDQCVGNCGLYNPYIFGNRFIYLYRNIVSHIVRRHVLWDRQQDLVRRINWNIKQHADETEIESLKYEERDVFNTMALHKRMILLNIVNIVIMLFLAVVIAVLMNIYIFKGIV